MGFWTVYFGIEGGGGTGPGGTENLSGLLGIVTVTGKERRGRPGCQPIRFWVGPFRATGAATFTYRRPGGVDTYFRPGGVDGYVRP